MGKGTGRELELRSGERRGWGATLDAYLHREVLVAIYFLLFAEYLQGARWVADVEQNERNILDR